MRLTPVDLNAVRARLQAVYQSVDDQVRQAGPVCDLSGRCCRFQEYDHTLFVSEPEAALLLADSPPPVRPLDDGATCPWQNAGGACTAREARPLGCRVYFCDPTYQDLMQDITEDAITRLKRVVEEMGLPWGYAPLHRHLHQARDAGQFPGTARSVGSGELRGENPEKCGLSEKIS